MVSRAQVSLEFLMVVGIAMVLLTASSVAIFQFTQQQTDQSDMQQAATVGYQIINQAANVYTYGSGSFVRVTGNVPSSVQQIYVVEDTLIFEVRTREGIVPVQVFSDIPINGIYASGDGKVHVNASGSQIQHGNVGFRVESKGSRVEISQIR